MAMIIIVAPTMIITLRISFPYLSPLRQYLFTLKCPRAQEEKNNIRDKGSATYNPDSSSI